ncbi:hypothetical protein AC1031_021661 [Aphanomyces cochlioides]|nr:hypothetical protein AC1031_021661 [Aphanomyces cochlioides]
MTSTALPPALTEVETNAPPVTTAPTLPPATTWSIPRITTPEVTMPVEPSTPPRSTATIVPQPTAWPITRQTPSTTQSTPPPSPIAILTSTPQATSSLTPIPTGSNLVPNTLSPSSESPEASRQTTPESTSTVDPGLNSSSSQSATAPTPTAQTTAEPVQAIVPRVTSLGLSTAAPIPSESFAPNSTYSQSTPLPFIAFEQPNQPSSSKLIVSITAPLVACLALAVGLFLWRRQQRQKPKESNSSTNFSSDSDVADPWLQLEAYRMNVAAIELEKRIAMGSFGEVWLATFQNQVVAVKTCSHTSSLEIQSFVDELLLMSTFKSPYIVTFMGAAWTKPTDVKAILEYMNLGDLRQFLADTTPSSFSWPAKLECALNVARALVYLKSKHVIHRDLKSRNVLLDSAKGTKLGDFGISRLDSNESMTTGVGTYRWMAPEILTFRRYTAAVDVYSFGVLLSELDTHQVPYSDVQTQNGHAVSDGSVICRVIQSHFRPSFSRECPPWLFALASQCMLEDPTHRPEPSAIVVCLEDQLFK